MPDKPAASSVSPEISSVKKHKRGDVRGDGKIFWCYAPKLKSGEAWVTKESFENRLAKEREKRKRNRDKIREYHRQWVKNNPEKPKKYYQDSQQRNPGERARKQKEWRKNNPGKHSEYCRAWTKRNPEKAREVSRNYRQANQEKTKLRNAKWLDKNRDRKNQKSREWGQKNKNRKRLNNQRWREKNLEKDKRRAREYVKRKKKSDPVYHMAAKVRVRIRKFLLGLKKTKSTKDMLGLTYEDFAAHVESQFLPGMSWENRSEWHIDHIVPASCARNESEVYTLNHYTNLRPLWSKDNISKGKKLPEALPEYIHADVKEIWLREQKQHDQRTN